MKNVLLVEDSQMFGKLAIKKIEQVFNVPVTWTKNMADTEKVLAETKGDFSCALIDVNLPDAPDGEVIDKILKHGITSFVFTTNMTDEMREYVWSKKVADYILKEDPNSLDYIISAMKQLEKNSSTLILVVDDSSTSRTIISELLYVRKYRVLNASDGKSALQILEQYPEIKLVITDYQMPGIDGYVLCQKIRETRKADSLAIIGISSAEDRSIGARFIKSGANDFVVKQDFLVEEFYSRVKDCLETVELFEKLRDAAINDFLTGLHNRRHFFDVGTEMYEKCVASGDNINCTLLDIDFFKKVNDNYGHDIGDEVLRNFAKLLKENASEIELVSRFGGEEFCILTPSLDVSGLIERFESLREIIEQTPMATLSDGTAISVTCSFGICSTPENDIDAMIKVADENLYKAKEGGRNRINY